MFTRDVLDAPVRVAEAITGPARRSFRDGSGGTVREYTVDGCNVAATVRGGNVVALSLGLTPRCTVDLSTLLGSRLPTANALSFGQASNTLGRGRMGADCLVYCGNAADPVVYWHWEGPRALGFIEVRLEATVAGDRAVTAAQRWAEVMERREGQDYVIDTRFRCDGRFDEEGLLAFNEVRANRVVVGRDLGPEGCAPQTPAPAVAANRQPAQQPPDQSPRTTAIASSQTRVGPSFDCNGPATAREPLAQLICMDLGLSRLDLAFAQAFQALRQQAGEAGLRDLRREAVEFSNGVVDRCGLPRSGAATSELLSRTRSCIDSAYREQRRVWLDRLSPQARQEAERDLERHIALQRTLQTLGHLPATATIDGVYGPATRSALMAWQQATGRNVTPWLSDQDAIVLGAAAMPSPPATGQTATATPPESDSVAALQAALRAAQEEVARARREAEAQSAQAARASADAPARASVDAQARPTAAVSRVEALRREPTPFSPGLAEVVLSVGCGSRDAADERVQRFATNYENRTMVWTGRVHSSGEGWVILDAEGRGRRDVHVALLSGQEALNLQASAEVTLRARLVSLGTCIAPFRAVDGVVLRTDGRELR